MIFTKDSDTYASFEKLYDADGKVWVEAVCANDLVAKTPYFIIADEYGPVAKSLSDLAVYCFIGFPAQAYSSGAVAKLQIGGPIDDAITPSLSISVGHSVTINTGAIADGAADFTGAVGEFASCRTVSTTSTTQDLMLVPERILSIT